jgi:NitT/TauT family transport system substrate-binding protein
MVRNLFVFVLLCALAVVPLRPARAAVTEIRVSLICGSMTSMLAEIAIADGSFTRAGILADKYCFPGGAPAGQALIGRSIDVHIGGYELVLLQRARGFDVKGYAEIYDGLSYQLLAKSNSPYGSVADLKGQTLGTTTAGTLGDEALRTALGTAHLNADREVQIVQVGAGAPMVAALDTGRIAAGVLAEPTASQLVADGRYKVLWSPTTPYPGSVVMARVAWVNDHRDAMRRFLKVLADVYSRTARNPSSAIAPLENDFPNVSPRIMLQSIMHQLAHVPRGFVIQRRSHDIADQMEIETGTIKVSVPYGDSVDSSYLPK